MSKLIDLKMNLKDGVTNTLSKIRNQTKETTKGFDVLHGKMKMLKAGITGIVAGMAIGQVVDTAKDLMNAYAIQRKAEQAVNDSLYANMKARGESQSAIDKEVRAYTNLASKLQGIGVIGDEVTLSGMAMATQMGLSAEQVREITPLMQDLAVKQEGLNVSQESFTELNKDIATSINMGRLSLQKYGIQVTDADKKAFKAMKTQERYEFIMRKLRDSVAGVNKKLGETPEGKLARINNEIGDIKEQLGQQINLLIEPMLEPMLNFTKWLNGDFQNIIGNVKGVLSDFFAENTENFTIFDDILQVWQGAWVSAKDNITQIVKDLGSALTDVFTLIRQVLKGDLLGAWDTMLDVAKDVTSAVGNLFQGMSNAIIGAFNEIIGKGQEWREEQERLKEQAKYASNPNNLMVTGGTGVAKNATGTSYFKGGLTHINENNRGEIVALPNGTSIIPHDVAVKQDQGNTYNVNVNIQGNVIGNEEYTNYIGDSIVQRLQLAMNNI